MNDKLNELLQDLKPSEIGAKTPFCPEDSALAKWYDGQLGSTKSRPIERHLPSCAYCRARVGLLGRMVTDTAIEAVAGDVLASAKQLVPLAAAHRRFFAPAWAAAAVVVLGLGLFPFVPLPGPGAAPVQNQDIEPRQLRTVERLTTRPEFIQPAPQAVLDPGTLNVQWTPVGGALHYDVLLMDVSGRLLSKQRVPETRLRIPSEVPLEPGKQYYLRVNALLQDGRTEGSKHTSFTVAVSPVKKRLEQK